MSEEAAPGGTDKREYIAFISYRHLELDKKAAEIIQKRIERYVIPKELRSDPAEKRLGKVFRDEDELPLSGNLTDSITRALDASKFLIVICSPDLPKSRWCEAEIRYFLKTHDRDHVLAVLIDGTPEESFSPLLLHVFDADGHIVRDVEPLAANIAGGRHNISRKALPKETVRIFAALMNRSFDDVWQRERRRKNRIVIAALAATITVMSVFIGTVWNLYVEAKNERNRALAAEAEALIARDDAEAARAETEESNKNLRQSLIKSYVIDGSKRNVEGDYQAALAYYAKALEMEPGNQTAKIGVSSVLQQKDWLVADESQSPVLSQEVTPPQSLYAFGALTQRPEGNQGGYVFLGENALRIWFPDTEETFEIARITEVSPTATLESDVHMEYLESDVMPRVVPLVAEDCVLFIEAFGGYVDIFAAVSRGSREINECVLVSRSAVRNMYREASLLSECMIYGLWADPISGTLVIDDYGNAIIASVSQLAEDVKAKLHSNSVNRDTADHLAVKKVFPLHDGERATFQIRQAIFKGDGSYALLKRVEYYYGDISIVYQYDSQGKKLFSSEMDFYHDISAIEYTPDKSLIVCSKRGVIECIDSLTGESVASLPLEGYESAAVLPDGRLQVVLDDGSAKNYTIARLSAASSIVDPSGEETLESFPYTVERESQNTLILRDAEGNILDRLTYDWPDDCALRANETGMLSSAILWTYDDPVVYWVDIDPSSAKFTGVQKIVLSDALAGSTYHIDHFKWGCAVSVNGPAVCIYNAETQTAYPVKLQHQGYVPFRMAAREDGYLAAFISEPAQYYFFAEIWDYKTGIQIATIKLDHTLDFDGWLSMFTEYGAVRNQSHMDWPLFLDDPDQTALQAIQDLCCYALSEDQMLEIKTPAVPGNMGSWASKIGIDYPWAFSDR